MTEIAAQGLLHYSRDEIYSAKGCEVGLVVARDKTILHAAERCAVFLGCSADRYTLGRYGLKVANFGETVRRCFKRVNDAFDVVPGQGVTKL